MAISLRACVGDGLPTAVEHPSAWTGRPAVPVLRIDGAAADALRRAATARGGGDRRAGGCAAAREVMAAAAREVRRGKGFAIVKGLPTDGVDDPLHSAIATELFGELGCLVDQKVSGASIYEVRDRGRPLGPGVRRSTTRLEQEFHTDGGWLRHAPEVIGLYCIRPAARGGDSLVASLTRAHNTMLQEAPAALRQLYRPLWWDRQSEHAIGELPYARQPVFTVTDSGLYARLYADYVLKGYQLAHEVIDTETRDALEHLQAQLRTDPTRVRLRLGPGEMLLVNNRLLAHARSAFGDPDGHGRDRLLLRLWTRPEGSRRLEGD